MTPDGKIALMGIPSSAGAWCAGQEKAPSRLRQSGLVERLRSRGLNLVDLGDRPVAAYRPDPENPKEQNLDLVCAVALDAAAGINETLSEQSAPLALGGGCTITIGVLSGLVERFDRLGLAYFDGDLDFNIPEVSPSGVFDGMVLSHILGLGSAKLSHVSRHCPLVPPERAVAFAYNAEAGWIDPFELETLDRLGVANFPVGEVRKDPIGASRAALRHLEGTSEHFLLHFDVDALDCAEFPAADAPHKSGLPIAEAIAALRSFRSSPKCVGLVVTEYNPDLDPDASAAHKLIDIIADVLS